MNASGQRFDSLRFLVVEFSILVIVALWVVESIRKRDFTGGLLSAGAVLLALTAWNYWRVRYRKTRPK